MSGGDPLEITCTQCKFHTIYNPMLQYCPHCGRKYAVAGASPATYELPEWVNFEISEAQQKIFLKD